jgi:hypothetical protein
MNWIQHVTEGTGANHDIKPLAAVFPAFEIDFEELCVAAGRCGDAPGYLNSLC